MNKTTSVTWSLPGGFSFTVEGDVPMTWLSWLWLSRKPLLWMWQAWLNEAVHMLRCNRLPRPAAICQAMMGDMVREAERLELETNDIEGTQA